MTCRIRVCPAILAALLFVTAAADVSAQNVYVVLNGGLVFGEDEGFYADDPFNVWYDRETGVLLGTQVYRQIAPTFLVGVYTEYETINIADFENGSRFGFGLTFVGRYPGDLSSGIGFEMGGMLGPAFASAGDFDSQTGVDFGVFAGPVLEVRPGFQIALHVHGLYGWYGGGDVPEGVQNAQPRLRLNLYYGL